MFKPSKNKKTEETTDVNDSELTQAANASVMDKVMNSSAMESVISSELAEKLITTALIELKDLAGPAQPLIACIQLIYNVSKAVYRLVKIDELYSELETQLLCVSEFYRQFQRYLNIQETYRERADPRFEIVFPENLEIQVQSICGELIAFLTQYLPPDYFTEKSTAGDDTTTDTQKVEKPTGDKKTRFKKITDKIVKRVQKLWKKTKMVARNVYVALSYEDTNALITEKMILLLQCFVAISSSLNNQFVILRQRDKEFFEKAELSAAELIKDTQTISEIDVDQILTTAQTTVNLNRVKFERQNGMKFSLSPEDQTELDQICAEDTQNDKENLTSPDAETPMPNSETESETQSETQSETPAPAIDNQSEASTSTKLPESTSTLLESEKQPQNMDSPNFMANFKNKRQTRRDEQGAANMSKIIREMKLERDRDSDDDDDDDDDDNSHVMRKKGGSRKKGKQKRHRKKTKQKRPKRRNTHFSKKQRMPKKKSRRR